MKRGRSPDGAPTLKKHDQLGPGVVYPTLKAAERKRLDREFVGKTWTGLTLAGVLSDVRDQWPEPPDRRFLRQIHDIVHAHNNTLLHHNARALNLAGTHDAGSNVTTLNVGPSETHIWGGLFGAFFSYVNTMSLVMVGEANKHLHALYLTHIQAFVSLNEAKSPTETAG